MADDILVCCDCGHKYKEDDAKRIPDSDCWIIVDRVCPECDSRWFSFDEVADD